MEIIYNGIKKEKRKEKETTKEKIISLEIIYNGIKKEKRKEIIRIKIKQFQYIRGGCKAFIFYLVHYYYRLKVYLKLSSRQSKKEKVIKKEKEM